MVSRKTQLALCGVVMFAVSAPALAGHYEAGQRAYEKRDYATALREWQAGADAGELESGYELSIMYRDGEGVPQDRAKFFALARRAAEAGYYLAQENMVASYHQGIGVKADDAEATRWVRRRAEQGDSKAMRDLAWALRTGTGVAVDKAGAAEWYERSFLYDDFNPAVVPHIEWDKYPASAVTYDELVEKGDLPKPDLKARFRATLARADAGDGEAQFQVAMMYLIARGAKADRAKMVEYLRKAADQGHAMAQLRLANTYIQGIGGNPVDEKKAAYWLYQAALQKNPFAVSLLGASYWGARGVAEDRTLGNALMAVGAFYGDRELARMVRRRRVDGPPDAVDASDAIAYKCFAQGMRACLPSAPDGP
jgi:TPR repeat protein